MFMNVLVLSLIFVAKATGYSAGMKYYPSCPAEYPVLAVCGQFCDSDLDCSHGQFCCRAGCQITCVPKPKEGLCPAEVDPELCSYNQCKNDQDCPGIQKCCGSDYCKTCEVPVKPGSCPKRYGFSPCHIECTNDFDCTGDLKCCGICPRICEKPCEHDDN